MALVTLTSASVGEVIRAAFWNAELGKIINQVNGNLDTTNIKDNSVTAAKIASSAVTEAKINNEAVTENKIKIGTPAEGDMLIRGASTYENLVIGTASQFLRVNSGATAPEWARLGISSYVLNKTSSQNTTSLTAVTVDFGTTDYIEIADPAATDEVIVIFNGNYNQNSGSYNSLFEIQENSSGSYAQVTGSLRTYRSYGDGNTYDSFNTMAMITGKSSTYRISAAFYVSSSMTLTINACTMVAIHIQK
jgi:hypothetical protein